MAGRGSEPWQEGALMVGGEVTLAGCVWEGFALRGFITGLPKMCPVDIWNILS